MRFNFTNKIVLDIGCNSGGMLHSLANKIQLGVGVDRDGKCVNAANLTRSLNQTHNLWFYTIDLEKENLTIIEKFLLGNTVDICFLLSVCMWITNWKEVIAYASQISEALLFESNGSGSEQTEQVDTLHSFFNEIQLIHSKSLDDVNQHARKLYLCQNSKNYSHK